MNLKRGLWSSIQECLMSWSQVQMYSAISNKSYSQMSLLDSYYPRIEEARFQIEARIRQLEDKLFSRKDISQQIQHQQLQCNIANIYRMISDTAESQRMLQLQLSQLKAETSMDYGLETRIQGLQVARRQAEERAKQLQLQLGFVSGREERQPLYFEEAMARQTGAEIDARIALHKARLEEDSRRIYENQMRNGLSQEQMELDQLRRDREAFERSYRNYGSSELLNTNSKNKYHTNSFGSSYYGRANRDQELKRSLGATTDYKQRPQESYEHSFRKEQETKTQPSPSRFRSPINEIRSQAMNESSGKDASAEQGRRQMDVKELYPTFGESQRPADRDRNADKERDFERGRNSERENQGSSRRQKPSATFIDKTNKYGSNSDSLDEDQNSHPSPLKNQRSDSELLVPRNKRPLRQSPQSTNLTFSSKTQKSPSKQRKQVANKDELRKSVLQRIQNRVVHAWAVYEDSTFRNTKHEKDHLFNTYALEMRLRNEIRDKVQVHPLVQRRFGLIVD